MVLCYTILVILYVAVHQKRAGAAALSPAFSKCVKPTLLLSASRKVAVGSAKGFRRRWRRCYRNEYILVGG